MSERANWSAHADTQYQFAASRCALLAGGLQRQTEAIVTEGPAVALERACEAAGGKDVRLDGESHLLAAGQLMFLKANLPHSLVALEDASALVTIVLHQQP